MSSRKNLFLPLNISKGTVNIKKFHSPYARALAVFSRNEAFVNEILKTKAST
jgi:hypothetical protein